jgi:Flp pilus assembly protein TadB
MQASVDRVRALMTRATDLTQVVALESELSRRQADLEALESQLAALKDSVAMSPVQVSLTTVPGVIATDAGTGFLAGLTHGWRAFTASVVVVLTVLGAVLPFAVLALVVGIPLWWWLRRRRSAQPTAVSAG